MAFGLAQKVQLRKKLSIVLCIAIFSILSFGIAKVIKDKVNAATGNVRLSYNLNNPIPYGSSGASAIIYHVQANTGEFLGFCGNYGMTPPAASTDLPVSQVSVNNDTYKRILLAIYAYEGLSATPADTAALTLIQNMFPGLTDNAKIYGWLHSVISSYYYNNSGLSGSDIDTLNHAKSVLESEITNNGSAWVKAQNYNLYSVGGNGVQTIFWIEPIPTPPAGAIKVMKKDATTHNATPQGNATFAGIKFIVKQGQTEKGSCTIVNDNSTCTISNLEYGTYTVWEAVGIDGQTTHPSYNIDVNSSKTVTINSGSTVSVEFENEVRKGSVKVRKKDSKMQDGECKTTTGHSFNGITFSLYLSSGNSHPIVYNGQTFTPTSGTDPLIDSKSIGSTGCEVVFNDLPYGKYYIKETQTNNDYTLNSEVKYVNIPGDSLWQIIEVEFSNEPTSISTVAVDSKDGDKYIDGSENASIKDTIQYCVAPNKQYTIKGILMDKSSGKKLLVNGRTVEASVDIKPATSCGSAVMDFSVNAADLGGKEIVVFEELYEYKSDGNYDNEDPILKHEDINDSNQTVIVISLGTIAKDGTDDDKEILAAKGAVVKDTVSYCAKPGQKYMLRGILMNKSTGEPLLVDGNKVEGEIEIEPTEACGVAEMLFHFDATGLQGTEIVVFEKLYLFEDIVNGGDPIITHEDINDAAQAAIIYLPPPPPNTGQSTKERSDAWVNGFILIPSAAIVTFIGYGVYRTIARRRFFGNR